MTDTLRVSVVQINSQSDKQANLQRAGELIDQAAASGARLVALPEYVAFLGPTADFPDVGETIPGPTSNFLAGKAREHGIFLLGGSFHEQTGEPGKNYNTSVLFGPDGEILARYRKIHLFDIDISGNVSANESNGIRPGDELVTATIDGHTAGLSICYDLRFPELYRLLALAGAEILFVPAAFTLFTGKDHWEVLLRTRAIENQAYVIAPGQIGKHDPNNAQCYGNSMIIDPWGTVIARASDREGIATADLDFSHLRAIRKQLPSLANRRPSAYRERQPSAV